MEIHAIKVLKLARGRCCLIADKDSGGVQAGWLDVKMGHAARCGEWKAQSLSLRNLRHLQPSVVEHLVPSRLLPPPVFHTRGGHLHCHTQSMVQVDRDTHHHIRAPNFIRTIQYTIQHCKTAPHAKSGNRRLHFHSAPSY